MNYDLAMEKLMQAFTSGSYEEDVALAKTEFFKSAGMFDEESADFEMKMSQFMDWYLFARPLINGGQTPINQALAGENLVIAAGDEQVFKNLGANRHSLFEFLKSKGSDIHIKDLFSEYKMVVKQSNVTEGFDREEIFEARLIPHKDNFVFSGAFCFHPPQTGKYILKEVKKIKKLKDDCERDEAREDLINKLFKMRYKHEQYRHVDLLQIYSNEPKLRL